MRPLPGTPQAGSPPQPQDETHGPQAAGRPGLRHRLPRVLAILLLGAIIVLGLSKVAVEGYASYHIRAADKLLERQSYELARLHLEAALKARPTSATLHLRLGRLCRQLDGAFLPESFEHLRTCRRLEGETEEYQLEMLMAQAQAGQGEFVYDKLWIYVARDRPEAPLICESLARAFMSQGLLRFALQQIEHWLEMQPENVQALYLKGFCLNNLGAAEDASHLLQQALDRDPERDDIRQVLAFALAAIDHYSEAAALHEQFLQKHPDDALAYLGLARCRLNQGHPEEAQELLDRALARNPTNVELLAERGKVALLLEQPEQAEDWLRKALKIDPHHHLANFQLQACLTRLGRETEAMAVAAANRKLDADMKRLHTILMQEIMTNRSPALYHEVGTLQLATGHEEGLLWLYKALALDPEYRPTNEFLADYWEKAGDPERAARHRARLPQH
jgi:tetratricopeptide (TPR) repeat protein